MNLKQAYDIGFNTGYDIASENISDYKDLNSPNQDLRLIAPDKFISDMLEVESEHFRQFSPFEFTAKEFNESRNPDITWKSYEDGVYKGILKRLKEYTKSGY